MTPDFAPFLAELETFVGTVWTEVLKANGGGGVWVAEHVDKVPKKGIALPYAVILIEQSPLWEKRPINSLIYAPQVWIHYVQEARTDHGAITTKLQALANACWPGQPLSTARRVQMAAPVWEDSLPANQVLRAANFQARAGALPVTFLVGTLRT